MTLLAAAIPLGYLLLYKLILLVGSVQCILTSGPTDVHIVKGSAVVLPCSTNLNVPVIWIYNRPGGDVGLLWPSMSVDKVQEYNARSCIDMANVQEGDQYDLVLIDVQLEDAGTYSCVDDEGFGYDLFLEGSPNRVVQTAQLNVIDNDLKCWSNVNFKTLKEDMFKKRNQYCSMITIHCNIKFGGTEPTLKWSLLNNSSNATGTSLQKYSDRTVKQNSKYSIVASKLQLSAREEFTNSYISCNVIDSGKGMNAAWQIFDNETIASKLAWISKEIIVQANAENPFSTDCTPSIEYKSPVYGLTVVDDEIFVLGVRQSQVSVYDLHSLKVKRDLNIPGLRPAETWNDDLAGCSHNKALYINDWYLGCIHRVDLKNNLTYRWNLKEHYYPRGLSLTAEHTLLVTAWISPEKYYGRGDSVILEYSSGGVQLREINISKSTVFVLHTIQLSSDRFIIVHLVSTPLYRVCVINNEGDTIQSYRFEAKHDLSYPIIELKLAIDIRRDLIFVADGSYNGVLILDKDLKYIDHIHATSDLRSPYTLYFDSSTDRLLIGEAEVNGRLLIISPPF